MKGPLRPLGVGFLLALALAPAVRGALAIRHEALSLGGAPVALYAVDLDQDGRSDLVAVTAGARWGERSYDEPGHVDANGALVEVLTVVPALFDRRTVVFFRGTEDGWHEAARLDLPMTVHLFERGPRFAPLLAWTDTGVAALRWREGKLALDALIERPTLFAGSEALFPPLGLAVDLDGDGERDVMIPEQDGVAIYLARGDRFAAQPASELAPPLDERLPGDARHYRAGETRHFPLPEARDLDGDGLPELLFRNHQRGWNQFRVLRNLGDGRFSRPIDPLAGRDRAAQPEVVYVGDLDGAGRGEVVTARPLDDEEGSLRKELKSARRPRFRYAIHRLDDRLRWDPEPSRRFELDGYLFEGDETAGLPTNPRDLDGDGRPDLVALRLDLSLFDAARVLVARSIHVGLEFAVFCQAADGGFRPTAQLTGNLKLRLEALRLAQAASFAGDFDGDGRADFLRLGPGRHAEIHLGRPGCRYAASPDLRFDLVEEPQDAALVRVRDLDGDGRSDIAVTRLERGRDEADLASTIDLYLSSGER